MKENHTPLTQENRPYLSPRIEVMHMDVDATMLTVSGVGAFSDIVYGGEGNDEEYGD